MNTRKRKQISVWHHQGVTGGVVRGAGKQLIGALCNLVGFYIIGLPIGVALMFAANMGIVGKNINILQLVPYVALSLPCQQTFRKAIKTLLSSLKKDCGQALPSVWVCSPFSSSCCYSNLIGRRLLKRCVPTSPWPIKMLLLTLSWNTFEVKTCH